MGWKARILNLEGFMKQMVWRSTEVATVFWPLLDAQKLAEVENFTMCRFC